MSLTVGNFKKRPTVVEAVQLLPSNISDVADWCDGEVYSQDPNSLPQLVVQTDLGERVVNSGDWIVRGVRGNFYPVSEDVFLLKYERAE